jgi:hypothetical protein
MFTASPLAIELHARRRVPPPHPTGKGAISVGSTNLAPAAGQRGQPPSP